MKYLNRLLTLFLLLFSIPLAFAEITITLPEKELYNLGEKIMPTISVKEEQDYNGFFSLHIFCDNYDLRYYLIPLSVEAGFRAQVTVPELPLSKSMTTKCSLKSNFEATDGENIDASWSKDFFVTDKVNITIDGDLEAKPGEDVIISGEARKYSNEVLPKGIAEITFKDKKDDVDVVSGKFEHAIHLDNDLEAGNIPILIIVRDKYANYGDKILSLKVLAVPTRIENRFENNILMPGDILKARVTLYDHTDRVMNASVNVKIFDPDERLLAEKGILSNNYLEFATEKIQSPGSYYLLSSFENIKEQSSFSIETIRKIKMSQNESFVNIENTGNVDYKDEVTIILESDDKKYIINKKIELKPGETVTIDLSKEVPQGTYDIILPEETVATSADIQNETQDIIEPQNVIKDVGIDDNRNVIKKTADGISLVTGAAISTAGYIASRPALATTILVLIILGTVTRYSWGFIKSKVKGKKDNASHLFEDFKFKKEEK